MAMGPPVSENSSKNRAISGTENVFVVFGSAAKTRKVKKEIPCFGFQSGSTFEAGENGENRTCSTNLVRAPHWSLIAAVVATLAMGVPTPVPAATPSLPPKVSDQEFWAMVVNFSENGGTFVSDNIISNEIEFQRVIPDVQKTKPHGVYVGVGPEQNFTYITAFKPSMAFILDIRRGNLLLHLTYKSLIELSADRIEFLSRLFARRAPPGVGHDSTARVLFDAFGAMPISEKVAQVNLRAILNHLERTHGFPLSDADERRIGAVYRSLYVDSLVRGTDGADGSPRAQSQLHRCQTYSGRIQTYRKLINDLPSTRL